MSAGREVWRSLNPPEVGGWFMIGFPLAAALVLRPSMAGAALAALGMAAFLMRVPLKQLRARVRVPLSRRLLAAGAALMLAAGAAAFAMAGPRGFLPLLAASPAAALALHADLRKAARDLGIELTALAFFCAFAAAVALAGGAPWREALGLWAQSFLSLAPGFAAVRYQLGARRDPEGPRHGRRWWTMHGTLLACAIAGALLWRAGLAGPGWLGLQVLLYGRAFAPLHRGPAWNLGVLEILADAASLTLTVLRQ